MDIDNDTVHSFRSGCLVKKSIMNKQFGLTEPCTFRVLAIHFSTDFIAQPTVIEVIT